MGVVGEAEMRVALYGRISTSDRQDVDLQLVPLREYALARGWAVQGEYVDRGVSGAKERRPAHVAGLDRGVRPMGD